MRESVIVHKWLLFFSRARWAALAYPQLLLCDPMHGPGLSIKQSLIGYLNFTYQGDHLSTHRRPNIEGANFGGANCESMHSYQ